MTEKLYFIGIIIPSEISEELLKEEFTETVVEWKKCPSGWCLFHKGRCFVGTLIDRTKISLNEHELQHFIGVLKRVRSDVLYQSYPDNLGLKQEPLSLLRIRPDFKKKGK